MRIVRALDLGVNRDGLHEADIVLATHADRRYELHETYALLRALCDASDLQLHDDQQTWRERYKRAVQAAITAIEMAGQETSR